MKCGKKQKIIGSGMVLSKKEFWDALRQNDCENCLHHNAGKCTKCVTIECSGCRRYNLRLNGAYGYECKEDHWEWNGVK